MFKELYPSDMYQIKFETSSPWLPFSPTLKEMIQQMNADIVTLNEQHTFLGWYEKEEVNMIIHVVFSNNTMRVNNAIVLTPNKNINALFDPFQVLITIAKSYRMTTICLNIRNQRARWEQVLKENGYSVNEMGDCVCRLSYHTGLVLGGGGARGAYQIGVWRALKKLGIHFDMISGTSVGALNGGLIIQGDLEASEAMWQNITTEKVMHLPPPKKDKFFSFNEAVAEFEKLTLSAIREKGVSTKPLFDLISQLLVPEKLKSSPYEFYLVTTELEKMEEKVVSLNEMTEKTFPLWLLASASFFPVMQACLVEGHYYIDGGYRDNIPKDVLIKRGATELIVVDVKGPGVTKPTKMPSYVVETDLKSPWPLGTVLRFDGNRANLNMTLGFLETQKAFGKYRGMRYTFSKTDYKKKNLQMSRAFFSFLAKEARFSEWFNRKQSPKIWDWLIKNELTPETIGISLMESLAKKLAIAPTQVYEIEEMAQLLINKSTHQEMTQQTFEELNHSLIDIVTKWVKKMPPMTEYQLLRYYYTHFKQNKTSHEAFFLLMDITWYAAFEALFLLFLEKRNR